MTKATVCTLAALLWLLAGPAAAAELNWWYGDMRYQRAEDSDVQGVAGEISGELSRHWVLQGRLNQIELDDDFARVTQRRSDLSLGYLLRLSNRLHALVSGGYTYLDYDADLTALAMDVDGADHLANAQVALRALLLDRLELEGSLGLLADEEDTSDLLWSAALRYHLGKSVALQFGVVGSDEGYASDEVVYELGFRFDLTDRKERDF